MSRLRCRRLNLRSRLGLRVLLRSLDRGFLLGLLHKRAIRPCRLWSDRRGFRWLLARLYACTPDGYALRLCERARACSSLGGVLMFDRSLLQHFAHFFVSRRDDFARQTETGRYVRVGRPVSSHDLVWHLEGQYTLGTYVIDECGRCRFAVYDDDTDEGLLTLWSVQQALAAQGIPSHLEHSRRGAHLWVFLAEPLAPALVRCWLLPYCPVGVAFYPKQDQTNGYGSLMRVPLGVHQLSGCVYRFVAFDGQSWRTVAASAAELVPLLACGGLG